MLSVLKKIPQQRKTSLSSNGILLISPLTPLNNLPLSSLVRLYLFVLLSATSKIASLVIWWVWICVYLTSCVSVEEAGECSAALPINSNCFQRVERLEDIGRCFATQTRKTNVFKDDFFQFSYFVLLQITGLTKNPLAGLAAVGLAGMAPSNNGGINPVGELRGLRTKH